MRTRELDVNETLSTPRPCVYSHFLHSTSYHIVTPGSPLHLPSSGCVTPWALQVDAASCDVYRIHRLSSLLHRVQLHDFLKFLAVKKSSSSEFDSSHPRIFGEAGA